MRFNYFLVLVLWLFTSFLAAQIVNIEDRRINLDSSSWHGQLDLGGNYTRNSSEVIRLNAGIRVDRLTEAKHQLLFLGDYRVVRAGGSNFLNAGFVHFRYGHQLKPKLQWEFFSQLQYDEKLRLSLRALVGSGPRFQLAEGDGGRIYLGILYMYEYDELRNASITFRDHRLSSYLSLFWQVNRQFTINNISYYQPRLIDFNQSRLSSSTDMIFKISRQLSLSSRFNMTYDARINDIFPEVPKLTFDWLNGLRLNF